MLKHFGRNCYGRNNGRKSYGRTLPKMCSIVMPLNRPPESELCGHCAAGRNLLDDRLLAAGEVRAELDLAVHHHRVRVRRLLLLGLTFDINTG